MSADQRPNRIITVSVTAAQYDRLLHVAETSKAHTVPAVVQDQIARLLASHTLTSNPVARMVIQGADDGTISRELGIPRNAVASTRRRFGLTANRPTNIPTRRTA